MPNENILKCTEHLIKLYEHIASYDYPLIIEIQLINLFFEILSISIKV